MCESDECRGYRLWLWSMFAITFTHIFNSALNLLMVADFYSSVNPEYIYSWDGKWEMSPDYRQRQSVPLVQHMYSTLLVFLLLNTSFSEISHDYWWLLSPRQTIFFCVIIEIIENVHSMWLWLLGSDDFLLSSRIEHTNTNCMVSQYIYVGYHVFDQNHIRSSGHWTE